MSEPLVSIVITAYGYEQFVAPCIDSCLAQKSSVPFEIVFIDDGSPDRCAEFAHAYGAAVRVFTLPNGGVEKASNFGFSQAKGRFIVRVDVDDILRANFLEGVAPYLGDNEWSFLYSDYERIDVDGKVISMVGLPSYTSEEIRRRGDFLATGTVYRTAQLALLGGYNEAVRNCGLENYELILRLIAQGGHGLHIAAPLFQYRVHSGNMSLLRREKIIEHGRLIAQQQGLGSYSTNSNHPYQLVL